MLIVCCLSLWCAISFVVELLSDTNLPEGRFLGGTGFLKNCISATGVNIYVKQMIRDLLSILCSENRKYVKCKDSIIHFCIFCLLTFYLDFLLFLDSFSVFPAASRGQLNLNYLLVK